MGRTSNFRNRAFITIIVVTNSLGNLLLAMGLKHMPDFDPVSVVGYTARFLTNVWILAGIALLIVWMIAQFSMFTWADLTYVLPVTASAYILTALLGKFFLGEKISFARWIGIALISAGVMFVSETAEWTHPSRRGERT